MRKFIFGILFSLVFLGVLSAQQGPQITIVNNTGYTVWYVQLSSTADEYWGEDRLANDQVLPNGQSFSMNLPHPLNVVNRYDIRLTDSDGDTYTKMNVLVSANSRIVFTFDDFDRETASFDGPPVTIVNNTGYEVWYVFISPTTDDSWGSDRLASNQVLRNGQSVSLNLPHQLNVTNRYDIRLVDSDGDTYTKMNVQVSANSRIEFTFSDID